MVKSSVDQWKLERELLNEDNKSKSTKIFKGIGHFLIHEQNIHCRLKGKTTNPFREVILTSAQALNVSCGPHPSPCVPFEHTPHRLPVW